MSAFENDEQHAHLVESARRYVERGYGASVRQSSLAHPDGCNPARWTELAELGWLALPLSEAGGGLGGSLFEVCLIAEELGRGLVIEPYVACATAGALLADAAAPWPADAAAEGQCAQWLPALAAGARRIALAAWEPGARFDRQPCATVATRTDGGYRLRGRKSMVLGAPGANAFIIVARVDEPGSTGFVRVPFLVEANAPGLKLTPYALYDVRHAADLELDDVSVGAGMRIGAADISARIERFCEWSTIAHCAETVGTMAASFGITLEYLKTRKQFGRTLASNQALQHRLVDMYVAIEESRAITQAAAQADTVRGVGPAFGRSAAAAKAYVSQAARMVWKECVQLHGAIGMTDEYVLGHHIRRLAAAVTLYGDDELHLVRLASYEDALAMAPTERSF